MQMFNYRGKEDWTFSRELMIHVFHEMKQMDEADTWSQ